ncbi:MAG: hypothetical protein GXO88_03570 [Chlorobi bacterium]|nr:hypothetical protein [Chlorobiota bacterium]
MLKESLSKSRKRFGYVLFYSALALAFYVMLFHYLTDIDYPSVEKTYLDTLQREKTGENSFKLADNYLQKNKYGLWEIFLEGKPYEIGLAEGKLTKELIGIQEEAFVEQINTLVPSPFYLKLLKHGIAWFNKDLDDNIPLVFQQEIFGVSRSVSSKYNYIAPPYERMLNYHAAHDIGHALQDLALVGCTSFGLNLNRPDSNMIIGRNFDFHINEKFSENKLVAFVKPDSGFNFVYVSWASMIGVVSGMNDQGLTVTLNAAKSDIPFKSATPISILAREILQFASNIEEAVTIANKRHTFVSEQILIGSAKDNTAIVIEKSPSKSGIYKTDEDFIVSSNHFQSELFANDENNVEYMRQSASVYRAERCEQLIEEADTLDVEAAVDILRDKRGLDGKSIGIGNEKAMCQMISHHAVVFQPERLKMWVSASPYQLGEFVCYDLKDIFRTGKIIADTNLTIAKDTFLLDGSYRNYQIFRDLYKAFEEVVKKGDRIANYDDLLYDLIRLNPDYYKSYVLAADYFIAMNDTNNAIDYLQKALSKEFENTLAKRSVEAKLRDWKNKRKNKMPNK